MRQCSWKVQLALVGGLVLACALCGHVLYHFVTGYGGYLDWELHKLMLGG